MDRSAVSAHGEVREEFRNQSTARFEWTIPGYKLPYGYYTSATVEYFKNCWYLAIWVERGYITVVSLHREILTPGIPESILCTIRWKKGDGRKTGDFCERDIARDETITRYSTWWTVDIPRPSVIPPQKSFTFTCTLRTHVSAHARGVSQETQTEEAPARSDDRPSEDISILRKHLMKLLLTGDDHDLLLKVKDKQFRAHKNILRARSPVFAGMFTNKMMKSAKGSITIKDCDPDAFGEFLHYVYTGEVDLASASSALALYYAGNKYDFPRLKEICVHFLRISFTASTVFEVIQLAARHRENELFQLAIVYFANHLEEVILTAEWKHFRLTNPIEANVMRIKAEQFLKSSLNKK